MSFEFQTRFTRSTEPGSRPLPSMFKNSRTDLRYDIIEICAQKVFLRQSSRKVRYQRKMQSLSGQQERAFVSSKMADSSS